MASSAGNGGGGGGNTGNAVDWGTVRSSREALPKVSHTIYRWCRGPKILKVKNPS